MAGDGQHPQGGPPTLPQAAQVVSKYMAPTPKHSAPDGTMRPPEPKQPPRAAQQAQQSQCAQPTGNPAHGPSTEPPKWFADLFLTWQPLGKGKSQRRGPSQDRMEMRKYWQVCEKVKNLSEELMQVQLEAGVGDVVNDSDAVRASN